MMVICHAPGMIEVITSSQPICIMVMDDKSLVMKIDIIACNIKNLLFFLIMFVGLL